MMHNKGYTLLFAVLTAALVLGVASFILGFAKKQAILASTAKESMHAIYAADSGIECAMIYAASFASSTSASDPTPFPAMLTCNNQTLSVGPKNVTQASVGPSTYPKTTWDYTMMSLENEMCAKITVTTGKDMKGNTPTPYTRYESRGYNKCALTGGVLNYDSAFPRIVERGIQVTDYGVW